MTPNTDDAGADAGSASGWGVAPSAAPRPPRRRQPPPRRRRPPPDEISAPNPVGTDQGASPGEPAVDDVPTPAAEPADPAAEPVNRAAEPADPPADPVDPLAQLTVRPDPMAIASIVVGVIGIFVLGLIAGLVAAVLAAEAGHRARVERRSAELAYWGLLLAVVDGAFWILLHLRFDLRIWVG